MIRIAARAASPYTLLRNALSSSVSLMLLVEMLGSVAPTTSGSLAVVSRSLCVDTWPLRTWKSRPLNLIRSWNSIGSSVTTGMAFPNISSATITPRVRMSSLRSKISAAGALPFSRSSRMTVLPVHEPRPPGIARMASWRCCPLNGWCWSITSLVRGLTPPQKLNSNSLVISFPEAWPLTYGVPWKTRVVSKSPATMPIACTK